MFKFGFGAVGIVIGILGIIGLYKAFQKAGKPGLIAFIPILNWMNLVDMAGLPLWTAILLLVPGVNVLLALWVMIGIAHRFGRSWLFGVGLIALAPICWAMLGLGSATYEAKPA